jgi:hypothetical protein
MSGQKRWPRGRVQWLLGTIGLLIVGALVGFGLSNVWLGLVIGAAVSLGWLIAYESWRGRNTGVNDENHGIQL